MRSAEQAWRRALSGAALSGIPLASLAQVAHWDTRQFPHLTGDALRSLRKVKTGAEAGKQCHSKLQIPVYPRDALGRLFPIQQSVQPLQHVIALPAGRYGTVISRSDRAGLSHPLGRVR